MPSENCHIYSILFYVCLPFRNLSFSAWKAISHHLKKLGPELHRQGSGFASRAGFTSNRLEIISVFRTRDVCQSCWCNRILKDLGSHTGASKTTCLNFEERSNCYYLLDYAIIWIETDNFKNWEFIPYHHGGILYFSLSCQFRPFL
jgi:hypothetical protein